MIYDLLFYNSINHPLLAELADRSLGTILLMIGLSTIAGGLMLMFHHQNVMNTIDGSDVEDRIRKYEQRKYRRRMTTSSMIAAIGVCLSAIYWIAEPRAFAIMISMALALLVGVLGMAILDMMSVGLHEIAKPDDEARNAMIQEYLKQREKLNKDSDR